MLDGTAVKEIALLAKEGLDANEALAFVDGVAYTVKDLKQVPAPREPEPGVMTVHTLTGLVDYIRANKDGLDLGELVLQVVEPGVVGLKSKLTGRALQRLCYIQALAYDRIDFKFDSYYAVEQFVIKVQSQFQPTQDRERVLQIVGTVRDEAITTAKDDGVTQTVTAAAGLAVDKVQVPNPNVLAPFRTFVEIDQPQSPFILRLKKDGQLGITAGLFEADGGAWKIQAVQSIAGYLRANTSGIAIIA